MTERKTRQENPRLAELRARFSIEERFPHSASFDLGFVSTALVESIMEGDLDSLRYIRKASIMWGRTNESELRSELTAIEQIAKIASAREAAKPKTS